MHLQSCFCNLPCCPHFSSILKLSKFCRQHSILHDFSSNKCNVTSMTPAEGHCGFLKFVQQPDSLQSQSICIYIHAFGRCFNPKRLALHSRYAFIIMCVTWEPALWVTLLVINRVSWGQHIHKHTPTPSLRPVTTHSTCPIWVLRFQRVLWYHITNN